jgi:hypothetical protein
MAPTQQRPDLPLMHVMAPGGLQQGSSIHNRLALGPFLRSGWRFCSHRPMPLPTHVWSPPSDAHRDPWHQRGSRQLRRLRDVCGATRQTPRARLPTKSPSTAATCSSRARRTRTLACGLFDPRSSHNQWKGSKRYTVWSRASCVCVPACMASALEVSATTLKTSATAKDNRRADGGM